MYPRRVTGLSILKRKSGYPNIEFGLMAASTLLITVRIYLLIRPSQYRQELRTIRSCWCNAASKKTGQRTTLWYSFGRGDPGKQRAYCDDVEGAVGALKNHIQRLAEASEVEFLLLMPVDGLPSLCHLLHMSLHCHGSPITVVDLWCMATISHQMPVVKTATDTSRQLIDSWWSSGHQASRQRIWWEECSYVPKPILSSRFRECFLARKALVVQRSAGRQEKT